MLIKFDEINKLLLIHNIKITGVLHIGAHECEELKIYNKLGIKDNNIIWIDAISTKIKKAKARGIKNIYKAVITDKDNENVTFNISNNSQSSSILNFGTHSKIYPQIKYIDRIIQKSITVDTFFNNNINPLKYNFWNFDIQGAELLALKGSIKSIKNVDIIYLEVNVKELYKDCALINQIDAFLNKYSFIRLITKMTNVGWGDALYVRKNNL